MTPDIIHRLSPRALLRTALALVAAALVIGAPTAALAHDRLISSDPADGGTVSTSPSTITLTYSDDILDVSPVMRVTAEDGTVAFDGAPKVKGPDATATLTKPLPAGKATVQWRVVSHDGHPIEGTTHFTVTSAPSATPSHAPGATSPSAGAGTAASESASASAASSPASAPAASSTAAPASTEPSALSPAALAAIVGAIAAVVVIGGVFLVRSMRR